MLKGGKRPCPYLYRSSFKSFRGNMVLICEKNSEKISKSLIKFSASISSKANMGWNARYFRRCPNLSIK